MSWIDRINTDLVITTGDGKEFRPDWLNANKSKEYNVSEFTFADIPGSLVIRELPKGSKYNLELYFQGENNIEDANEFDESSDDKRAWTISHPYYDLITVQPLSLQRDNTEHNLTKFTISVVETISNENPRTTQDPTDKIIADQSLVSDALTEDFVNNADADIDLINDMNENNDLSFSFGRKIARTDSDFQDYFNSYNTATAAINNGLSDISFAVSTLQSVINAPALFAQDIKVRVKNLEDQFSSLRNIIPSASNRSSKKLYENNAGLLISSLTLALVTNVEYESRSEVLDYVARVSDMYSSYVSDLDSVQSENSNSNESYMPSYKSQRLLNDLVNYCISNLFDISIDARQERFVILENNDNIVTLAHRFYGLDVDDTTMDQFFESNDLGINDLLTIKKGRTLVYFV